MTYIIFSVIAIVTVIGCFVLYKWQRIKIIHIQHIQPNDNWQYTGSLIEQYGYGYNKVTGKIEPWVLKWLTQRNCLTKVGDTKILHGDYYNYKLRQRGCKIIDVYKVKL